MALGMVRNPVSGALGPIISATLMALRLLIPTFALSFTPLPPWVPGRLATERLKRRGALGVAAGSCDRRLQDLGSLDGWRGGTAWGTEESGLAKTRSWRGTPLAEELRKTGEKLKRGVGKLKAGSYTNSLAVSG